MRNDVERQGTTDESSILHSRSKGMGISFYISNSYIQASIYTWRHEESTRKLGKQEKHRRKPLNHFRNSNRKEGRERQGKGSNEIGGKV